MPPLKSASFDVLGTCFDFAPAISKIQTLLQQQPDPELQADPALAAKALFFGWFYAAQRDFTYLSLAGSYAPIAQVLKATFRRACAVADLPASRVSDDDVAAVMTAMTRLPPREGLKGCYDGLRAAGWDVYGVTNGGVETSLGYYDLAGIELDQQHLLSCDGIRVAKPDMRVYEKAASHLSARGCGEGERWFVAAHAWDLVGARKAGFKTAYLSFEEHDPVTEIFGEFDLYADSMEELLEKMKAL